MNEQLRAKLAAKLAKNQSQPEAAAPVVDPEVEALAASLMTKYARKPDPGAESTAPCTTQAPTQTVSMSEPEFQTLKNLKAAQARVTDLEKRAENLERSLTHVTETLAKYVMEQQATLIKNHGKLQTDWQIEFTMSALRISRTLSEVGLNLFVAWPDISPEALEAFDITSEDCENWRKWLSGYKLKPADHWLGVLADVQSGKLKLVAGQAELWVAALTHDGIDVKARLKELALERQLRWEREHPINDGGRGWTVERGNF
jgi:hypothetical protein